MSSRMNEQQLRIYRRERAAGTAALYAASIARATGRMSVYNWLNGFSGDDAARGEVDGLTVTVDSVPDHDTLLGEDDVTGWFTDTWEPGCIRNTVRNWGAADYEWYHPSNYDLTELPKDGSTRGMSKQVAAEYIAERIRRAMKDDANRSYWGVIVSVSLDGTELANASLWGVDILGDDDSYLTEVAEEQIAEALYQAREALPKAFASSLRHTRKLAAAASAS